MTRLLWVTWALLSTELVVGLPLVCWWRGYPLLWWPPWLIGVIVSVLLLWLLRRTAGTW